MAKAIESLTTSRRSFLSLLGLAGAATATATTAVAIATKPKAEESRAPFKHPSEYLAAMQAIGWRCAAMYYRTGSGEIVRGGVFESAPEDKILETWKAFHSISMRAPVQLASDVHPGGWWKEVHDYLWDLGLREDVTPTKIKADLLAMDERGAV